MNRTMKVIPMMIEEEKEERVFMTVGLVDWMVARLVILYLELQARY